MATVPLLGTNFHTFGACQVSYVLPFLDESRYCTMLIGVSNESTEDFHIIGVGEAAIGEGPRTAKDPSTG